MSTTKKKFEIKKKRRLNSFFFENISNAQYSKTRPKHK